MNNRQTQKNNNNAEKFERVPVSGLRDILTVYNKDKDFEYRFVADTDEEGSSIMRYKRGGWEFADSESHKVGQDAVYKSKKGSSIVRIPTGGGKDSYLMRIKKEWYDEDQKAQQDKIDELEATITRKRTTDDNKLGQYGQVKISRD